MSRYKHFDDELTAADVNEAAVLPELDVDEPHQLEFKPQLRNYASSTATSNNKFNLNYWKIFLLRRTRLERSLLFIIFCLLFLIFLISVSTINHAHDLPKEQQQQQNHQPTENICLTPACIQVSAAIYAGMNQSIDPCEDFYEFTCSRWIKTNTIPKGHSSWSTTKELARKNLIILKSILEGTVPNKSSSTFDAEQEAMKFYQSCLNLTEIERRQLQPMEDFFRDNFNLTIEQWIHIDRNQTWQHLFVSLTKALLQKYGFSYLLPIAIGPDDKNSTWNVLHVNIIRKRFVILFFCSCSNG